MAKVIYSPLAVSDLCDNAEHIANDKPHAAYRWLNSIESVCETLAENPEMGQARKSRNHGPCRSFVKGNYVIIFRGIADGVEIIRIVRGERDLDNV